MTKRISRAVALLGVACTILFGGAGIAQARHGADDPAGHNRHDRAERHHHHHHHRHHRHDDGANHR